MADHQGPEPREPRSPGALDAAGTPAFDLAAALGELDRATRNFAERLGARHGADIAAAMGPRIGEGRRPQAPAGEQMQSTAGSPGVHEPDGRGIFESRMREAEREAAEYLEHAKRRADSLVNAMVGAVEREAAEMRREAEVGIRARWQAVEVDAARHVEEARRVADRMVAERQQRIAMLSDGISGRAQALTAGMEDAERVRGQFETFIRALSQAADRIASAREPAAPVGGRPDDRDRSSAIAA